MAINLNPGADATLVSVAYRAAMANTPADYSDTLERAADSYTKTMEASSEMWGKVAKVGAISKKTAAATPAIRVLPPDLTFIIDCPIIAQPPIPPKKPVTVLAKP